MSRRESLRWQALSANIVAPTQRGSSTIDAVALVDTPSHARAFIGNSGFLAVEFSYLLPDVEREQEPVRNLLPRPPVFPVLVSVGMGSWRLRALSVPWPVCGTDAADILRKMRAALAALPVSNGTVADRALEADGLRLLAAALAGAAAQDLTRP